jgi:hypothetical protein
MMSRSERTIAYPRADTNDFHGPIRVTDIILDLFERPRSEEAAWRNRKDGLARRSKTCRDPNKILFSNPYFNDLPWD